MNITIISCHSPSHSESATTPTVSSIIFYIQDKLDFYIRNSLSHNLTNESVGQGSHSKAIAQFLLSNQNLSSNQNLPNPAAAVKASLPKEDAPVFDPEQHLVFKQMPDILTMQDIGMAPDIGVSPVAVTHPFSLFSQEAIRIMRSEISKPEVTQNYTFSSNIAAAQLRGYVRDHAPFTRAAWNHPSTIAIVSKLAGIDLVPWSEYEIAHINLCVKSEEQAASELTAINQPTQASSDDDKPIVGWHTDSYPFVCVLMMSDCTNMVGGETALRTASGEVLRVRGPTEGCAVILQGRYITHQALRALGAKERITAVTSWRPRSAFVKDDTELRTVRPVSDLNELYYDFTEYRLEIMEQRLRAARQKMRGRREVGLGFDTAGHKAFLTESAGFLQHTNQEIVEKDQVPVGCIETVDIPDVLVGGGGGNGGGEPACW